MLPMLLSLVLLGSGVSVADNPYNKEDGLSVEELVNIIKSGGFTDELIPEAVRIVLLESKGIPTKLQDNADDPAVGLFQVDLKPHWDLNPEQNNIRKWFINEKNLKTREEVVEWLKDPNNNAETAYEIYKERQATKDSVTGWEAWEAYNEGKKPDNRELSDWEIATKGMELAMTLLVPGDDDVLDDTKDMVGKSKPINTNVQSEGKEQFESQVPQQAGSFEGNQIKTNIIRDMQPMSPRKQKINNNFVKLFESMVRAE
jgi:hypothetical protein